MFLSLLAVLLVLTPDHVCFSFICSWLTVKLPCWSGKTTFVGASLYYFISLSLLMLSNSMFFLIWQLFIVTHLSGKMSFTPVGNMGVFLFLKNCKRFFSSVSEIFFSVRGSTFIELKNKKKLSKNNRMKGNLNLASQGNIRSQNYSIFILMSIKKT